MIYNKQLEISSADVLQCMSVPQLNEWESGIQDQRLRAEGRIDMMLDDGIDPEDPSIRQVKRFITSLSAMETVIESQRQLLLGASYEKTLLDVIKQRVSPAFWEACISIANEQISRPIQQP